mgnify:CR=1 FL=1
MGKRQIPAQHDRLVSYLAGYLRMEGYEEICADIDGYEKPMWVPIRKTGKSETPDLTCYKKQFHVFEVETEDSIVDRHTSEEWRLFASYAQEEGGTFWVAVPQGCEEQAREQIKKMEIEAWVWSI